jgi:hypothetical protein
MPDRTGARIRLMAGNRTKRKAKNRSKNWQATTKRRTARHHKTIRSGKRGKKK